MGIHLIHLIHSFIHFYLFFREIFSSACSVEVRLSKKPDQLYTFETKELGFLEAAKKSDECGNKEFKDACIKSPKVMKDMLLHLTKDAPQLTHNIRVPCMITSGKKIL
jgi:hypothetical protein